MRLEYVNFGAKYVKFVQNARKEYTDKTESALSDTRDAQLF